MNNENTLWATIMVDELTKSGVKFACISAGSRSTPLIMALAASEVIHSMSFVDERTAAFFALGIGLQSRVPAVLVCTSGTALANFYPAILEAKYSNIPLLILSADRPHDLRDSGSNQTMDQIKIFGENVVYFHDVLIPDNTPSVRSLRYLRTIISKSFANTKSGPVHLNIPFRKPLEPNAKTSLNLDLLKGQELVSRKGSYLEVEEGKQILTDEQLDILIQIFIKNRKGIIIAGPDAVQPDTGDPIIGFAQRAKYPILADISSNLRFAIGYSNSVVISTYELWKEDFDAELIILLGKQPVSPKLQKYLEHTKAQVISISNHGLIDGSLQSSKYYRADVITTFSQLLKLLESNQTSFDNDEWINSWKNHELHNQRLVKEFCTNGDFDASYYRTAVTALGNKSQIFLSNSLTIRVFDKYVLNDGKLINVYSNRGLSGIDGNLSIASGIAMASGDRIIAFCGDLAFYHDSNALLNIKKLKILITIVLLNNESGGIFHRLPISEFQPEFEEYFLTPHKIDFQKLVNSFGVNYTLVTDQNSLTDAIETSISGSDSTVIEIKSDARKFHEKDKLL